jgi:IS30 family transposase
MPSSSACARSRVIWVGRRRRSPRELRRNASTRSRQVVYRATTAQWHAERRAGRPKVAKLVADPALRAYVEDRLAGTIERPMAVTGGRGKGFVAAELLISQRPPEAARTAPCPATGEGDLIVGLDSSAIGTLVERTTRFTLLLHLPPMDGHGIRARTRNVRRRPVMARRRCAKRSAKPSAPCLRSSGDR